MKELIGTQAEVVAAVHQAPRLLEDGTRSAFVLAGEFSRTLASGEEVREVFFQPCMATGRLAARLGTLPKGTGLCAAGELVYDHSAYGGQFALHVQDAVRLPDHVHRLAADRRDGMRLLEGQLRTRLRGVITHTPQQRQLLEGPTVTNTRLGLTIKQAEPGRERPPSDRYAFLELAAYGDLGENLLTCQEGELVTVWGLLQHRRTADGESWFQRVEMTALERLHPGRAMV
ncbi:single-strand binding protein/Primosomal replication protein n (plasmid) [Deinococcus proteolyticus MRP]|uniref:Single-strand binding protein/Primosomal replication protein n n=1 Tax=Deinococcus proteolyticus (strain ATCC 35074 / DSM 20540 / JCM 6276 / NBRC 101906 / NCIMB 13154 / VKM Ac-1939 / CCM 2703 / MRP) TaxID=693977 RepID=F0RQM0_DEIPM|nr:single-stranded DNA-binding protein [Deinococcus proteolyticus]ADY27579.1 single-strand binding protein/Primosomal replication protein n [Deinococcus proteolyticus MRP]